jgi:CPA2 family monovalent cation:H+ antiporter-2/glutathione-regulated potassium-efflux system protein KefB
MGMAIGEGSFLSGTAVFLGAAVVAVPIFKRLGLGSVIGYLVAGAAIGPFGLALIEDAEEVLHFAEFGVVLLLFIIGLELKPSRLWVMRRDIFGLGLSQVIVTGAVLTALLVAVGLAMRPALVAGLGLALSSTAFALQILEEKGTLNSPYGNRAFAILLFQDLAIVPLLALADAGNFFPIFLLHCPEKCHQFLWWLSLHFKTSNHRSD